MLRFNNNFWTSDYVSGIGELYRKLETRADELTQFCKFVVELIQFENELGDSLLQFRDTDGQLTVCNIDKVIDQIYQSGKANLKLARMLEKSNLSNLRQYVVHHYEGLERHKGIFKEISGLQTRIKAYEGSLDVLRTEYRQLKAENEQLKFQDSSLEQVLTQTNAKIKEENERIYGSEPEHYKMSVVEVSKAQLRKMLEALVESHPEILEGLQVSEYLDSKFDLTFQQVEDFKFALVKNGFLKVHSGLGIGTKYAWTEKTMNFIGRGETVADDDLGKTVAAFEEHKKAVLVEFVELDEARCALDGKLIRVLNEWEDLEFDRRQIMTKCLGDLSGLVDFKPAVDITADLQKFIKENRIGSYRPMAIRYESFPDLYESNAAFNRVFGEDLVELTIREDKTVPALLYACLKHLDDVGTDKEAWDLSGVDYETFALRKEIVELLAHEKKYWSKKFISSKVIPVLGKYEHQTVISLVKLFFLELPEPLLQDIAEPVHATVDSLRTEIRDTLTCLLARFQDRPELHDVIAIQLAPCLCNGDLEQSQSFIKQVMKNHIN